MLGEERRPRPTQGEDGKGGRPENGRGTWDRAKERKEEGALSRDCRHMEGGAGRGLDPRRRRVAFQAVGGVCWGLCVVFVCIRGAGVG